MIVQIAVRVLNADEVRLFDQLLFVGVGFKCQLAERLAHLVHMQLEIQFIHVRVHFVGRGDFHVLHQRLIGIAHNAHVVISVLYELINLPFIVRIRDLYAVPFALREFALREIHYECVENKL